MDATDLLGERTPLIDRGDHFDWSDLFGWGFESAEASFSCEVDPPEHAAVPNATQSAIPAAKARNKERLCKRMSIALFLNRPNRVHLINTCATYD